MTRRLQAAIAIFIAVSALSVRSAQAELKNCASLTTNPGDYKVVLDDFAFVSEAAKNNADLAALRDRLQFNFKGQIDVLKASARELDRNLKVPLRLVFCGGRQPALDGSEFTDALAKWLNDHHVVVEMWGRLDLRPTPGGAPTPRAMIGYAMPPVQDYLSAAEAQPIHVLAYPKAGGAAAVEELENLPELAAFALVGLGTKAMRAKSYDLAVWAFTGAEAGFREARLAGTNQDVEDLLVYVKHAACLTRAGAQRDSHYTGPLLLVPEKTCAAPP